MASQQIIALLGDLLKFLGSAGRFRMGFERRRQRSELTAWIELELAHLAAAPHPAIHEARERWATTSFLRIDRDERAVEVNPDGTSWVRAWVKISTSFPASPDSSERRRFEAAVADMPEIMRQIFLAHALDNSPYEAIAEQLHIEVAEVQSQLGFALVRLADAVGREGEKSV